MPTLYSYCIPIDDGGAPNPFWGICTLCICKPVIRRTAQVGDWIVGIGSTRYNFGNKVVYAMEVTSTMTMQEYDAYCKTLYPKKIPNWWHAKSYKERVGDCVYDFSTNPPFLRKSVHTENNRKTDLGGIYCLLSKHFYYFGDKPEILPDILLPIVKKGQGHKSRSNDRYLTDFLAWIKTKRYARNKLLGEPMERELFMSANDRHANRCASSRRDQDEMDEQLGDE